MVALRAMLKPMREMAERRSVRRLPLALSAAEFASCSSRAASAGSALMTRTTSSMSTCVVGERLAHAHGDVGKARAGRFFRRPARWSALRRGARHRCRGRAALGAGVQLAKTELLIQTHAMVIGTTPGLFNVFGPNVMRTRVRRAICQAAVAPPAQCRRRSRRASERVVPQLATISSMVAPPRAMRIAIS